MNAGVMSMLQSGAALFQKGDFNAALASCEKVLAMAPNHPEALHLKALALGRIGRVEEAIPLFDAAAARHPQRHAILTNKGNALRAAKRLDEAVAAYSASVAANPNFVNGWSGLGGAYRELKNVEKAEDAFRKGLAAASKNADLSNNLGVLLVDTNRHEEAISHFSTALAAQPDMVFALVNRGAALRFLGRIDEALVDHRRAGALVPQNAEAQYQLANSLRTAGLTIDSERAYHAALLIAQERADIHRDLARLVWEMGDSDRYLATLDQAIAAHPTAELLTLKSELAYRAGLVDVADTSVKHAIAADSAHAPAYRMAGRLQRYRGDYDDAIKSLAHSLELAPGDFETLHDFAECLLASGDYQQAVDLLGQDAPDEHLQLHIALKALAMRLSGDDGYRRYYDYDRFARKIIIEPPEGFPSLSAFNEALAAAIMPLHTTKFQPIDQTLYGGTQSVGRLWDEPHPVIQALKLRLLETARTYVAGLPDDPEHPFLARKSNRLECAGAWSVVLSSGGGHVDHIHPEGWISASYYVKVPGEVLNSEEKAGFLRLGKPPIDGVQMAAERWLKPEAGAVIFFPSYIWHGVENFESTAPRITAPFDLIPVPALPVS